MNLNDKEILELNELCNALIDDRLTRDQRARLEQWLETSEEARRFYVRVTGLSASLMHYADTSHADAPDVLLRPFWQRTLPWWLGAAAALLLLALGLDFWSNTRTALTDRNFVARITGTNDPSWLDGQAFEPGDAIRSGQTLELASGFAEITFDSGATVVLEGPALLEVNSAWDSTLYRGALKANVPEQAIGFKVSNPSVEIVDLGTEFSVIADPDGTTDVFVLKGKIEAAPRDSVERDFVLLEENESRHFARSGISAVSDRDRKLARFAEAVSFRRPTGSSLYAHWSFDALSGDLFEAARDGFISVGPSDLSFQISEGKDNPVVPGKYVNALQFDGAGVAHTVVPGLSSDMARTLAFWVRVPQGAELSGAYSMAAWRADGEHFGSRPVHLGWNRNPSEGPLGVLRVDFSGGFALGNTSLRDGQWHFVTVLWAPTANAHSPVQLKLYVDGHLETNTFVRDEKRSIAANVGRTVPEAWTDVLWLGCRFGRNGPRKARFVGEMDELFVVGRILDPSEIVQLMHENQLTPKVLPGALALNQP